MRDDQEYLYNVGVTHLTIPEIYSYSSELEKVGYHPPLSTGTGPNCLVSYRNGEVYTYALDAPTADFLFSTNEPNWQEKALGVAAIRTDEGLHNEEWVVFEGYQRTKDGPLEDYYEQFTAGKLYQSTGESGFIVKKDDHGDENGWMGENLDFIKFHKASPVEILNFLNKKEQNMGKYVQTDTQQIAKPDKKLVGYRLVKDGPGWQKNTELIERYHDGGTNGYKAPQSGIRGYSVHFPDEVILANMDWFEPIYLKEVVKESYGVGSQHDLVTITDQGKIYCDRLGNGTTFTIKELNEVLKSLGNVLSTQMGGYTVVLDDEVRFIRVGCGSENHLFSIKELQKVAQAYYKLNPIK